MMLFQVFEQTGRRVQKVLLFLDLTSQLTGLHGAMQGNHQGKPVEGFLQKIVRALFHRLD